MKRAIGIVGSPRRGGNTEILVHEALLGAHEAGAEVEEVFVSELEISPCDACDACLEDGECVIDDDMTELLGRMRESDVWVLGTPVYWWGPSAQMKVFVDRWYCKAHRDADKSMFRGKRVVLAIPMGDDDKHTARHVVGMFTDALDYMDATITAAVLAPGANDPADVRKQPAILAEARKAGRDAATR